MFDYLWIAACLAAAAYCAARAWRAAKEGTL